MPRISILLVLVITIFRNSACAVVSEESDFFFFCDLVSLLQVYNVEPEPHHIDAGGRVASARRLQRTAVLPHLRDDDGRSLTNATRKHRNLEGVSLEESNIQRTGEGALALDAQALLPVVQFLVQGSGQDVDERDKVGWKDVDVGDVRDVWQAWLSSSASDEYHAKRHIWDLHRSPGECFLFAMFFCAMCAFGGWCCDHCRGRTEAEEIPWWVTLLTISSFLILVPGLLVMAFKGICSARITVLEIPETITVWQGGDSLWSVIETLFRKKRWISGNLCVFYCVVVPVVKFVLMTVLLVTRRDRRLLRRRATFWVKFLSKWDSPKIFSYLGMWIITIACHQPPTIDMHVNLGGGFLLFVVYCIGSLLAAVGLPDLEGDPAVRSVKLGVLRTMGGTGHMICAVGSVVSFFTLFSVGAVSSLLSLEFRPEEGLFLPPVKFFLQGFTLPPVRVNLFDTVRRMYGYTEISGSTIFVVFTVLLTFFVCLCTFLQVLGIAVATVMLARSREDDTRHLKPVRQISRVCKQLHYLAMLDVFVIGIISCVISASGFFKSGGFSVNFESGVWFLAGAEVVRWWQEVTLGELVHFSTQSSTEEKIVSVRSDMIVRVVN